jgi:hypothetical protein
VQLTKKIPKKNTQIGTQSPHWQHQSPLTHTTNGTGECLSPLITMALDNWILDIISISIALQLASIIIMPVPGVAYCIPVGPETRKLFLSKCIHSRRDPLPARAVETLYIIQLGVRQQDWRR